MFKTLIRPDYLFLIGVAQALSPYLWWAFGGGMSPDRFSVNYMPIAIWLLGYASFWTGCRLVRETSPARARFDLRPYSRPIVIACVVTVLSLLAQTAWAVEVYGTLPLFNYVAGDGMMDVATANDMQDTAVSGQFGLMIMSTCIANGFVLLLIILNAQEKRPRVFLLGGLLITLTFGNLINGKRQGLLITAVYIGLGILVFAGGYLKDALAYVPFVPRSRALKVIFLTAAISLGVFLMGKLADLRTQGVSDGSGVNEIIRYLEYPILNLSAQCDQSGGFGPYAFSWRYPVQRLLPFKMIEAWLAEDIPPPARVEKTSPSGMYEYIQWAWGPLGIILFSLTLGAGCTYVYRKALMDIRYFLIYPFFAYALLTVHSYMHFLTLAYVPVPSLFFWFFTRAILSRRVSKRVGGAASKTPDDRLLRPLRFLSI